MCFSFQIWSISNDSAKLRGLRECPFVGMYIHTLELNFSDFCKYSQISEINFPEKKHIEIPVKSSRSVSSINFENRLITGGKLSQINHRKASHQISKSSTSNLRHQSPKNMTKYVILQNKIYFKITAYTIKSQLKNYFIHYFIETFLSRDNFFDIFLVFVSFLQTYYDIYFSHILFFIFFCFR